MNSLQKALVTNATFSTTSALIMLIFSTAITNLFGLEERLPFLVVGIGLLFFAGTILFEVKRQRTKAVYWIIIQDILWVLGSVALLLLQPFGISMMGNVLIAAVAFIVLIFAIWQYWSVQKMQR
jgi:cytochrome c oxidase assembly factor CtaG